MSEDLSLPNKMWNKVGSQAIPSAKKYMMKRCNNSLQKTPPKLNLNQPALCPSFFPSVGLFTSFRSKVPDDSFEKPI